MKPPKCRACGSEHWSSEPHVWKREGVVHVADIPAAFGRVERLEEKSGSIVAHCEHGTQVIPKTQFDRTAYQREYMRKRRAEKRAHPSPE